jgi:hypothetical protein
MATDKAGMGDKYDKQVRILLEVHTRCLLMKHVLQASEFVNKQINSQGSK